MEVEHLEYPGASTFGSQLLAQMCNPAMSPLQKGKKQAPSEGRGKKLAEWNIARNAVWRKTPFVTEL